MSLESLLESPEILAAILFGSTAREDADAGSDKDIFVMCRNMSLSDLLKIKQDLVGPALGQEASICAYRYKDVVTMADKGSLFLWHLKLEGKVIFSEGEIIEGIFERLKEYNSYQDDLNCYRDLLSDIEQFLTEWGELSEFDLSLLFTISRNICMLLCYRDGQPKFGRFDVYYTARDIFGETFPMPERLYRELCCWKMWYERGVKSDIDSYGKSECDSIAEKVRKLLEFAEQKCL